MLRVEGLGKTYPPPSGILRVLVQTAHTEPVVALRDVTFDVRRGEVVGLVGPNGAGKSTLLRTIATLLEPTTDRVLVDGVDTATDPRSARARIGLFLNDDRAIYWRLSGRDNLRFFGVMAGLSPRAATARADELLEQFDLRRRDRRTFGYSSGMLVRLGLARALVANPPLLVLDEPSRALDPVASAELVRTLRALADDGIAVLLSNHRLDEIEETCDRVLVVNEGEQRLWTTMSQLRSAEQRPAETIRALLGAVEPPA